jgi:uncharacterized protein YukE
MPREVKVVLDADIPIVGKLEATKAAVKDLDDKVEALDRDLDKTAIDAAKTAAAMRLLSGDIRGAGVSIQGMGDKATALNILDTRIKSARDEVKKLTDEFTKTGDVDIYKKLGKSSGDLDALKRIRQDLAGAMGDGGKEGASTFSSFFQGGIIDAFKSLPGPLKAAVVEALIVAAIAVAAPVGAILNGAILAGIGGAGIGLGIIGQMDNPLVKASFTKLGTDLKASLTIATAAFAPALVNAAGTLDTALSHTIRGFGDDFDALADHVQPLAEGIAGMFDKMAPGLADAMKAAGPLLDQIGQNLPELGDAFDRFFAMMADGSEGASKGIDLIFLAMETLVVGVGGLIDGFSHLYDWFLGPGEQILSWWDRADGAQTGFAHRLGDLGPAAQGAAGGVISAADAMSEKFKTLDSDIGAIGTAFSHVGQSAESAFTGKVLDQMFGLEDATIAFQTSLAKLDDAAKKNGTSLDILNEKTGQYSDKALANEKVLISAAKANAELYQQNLLSGMSAADASAAYDKGSDSIRKQAIAAGYNAKAVDGLIGKYKNIPERVQTLLATIGLTDALNRLGQILIDLRTLDGKSFASKYTLTSTVVHVTQFATSGQRLSGSSRQAGFAEGGIRHAATGLIVGPSDPGTLIGEPQTGGELNLPLRGIPQMRAQMLMQTAGNGYGLDVVPRGSGSGSAGVVKVVAELRVTGRGELATVLQGMVRKGSLQLVPQTA